MLGDFEISREETEFQPMGKKPIVEVGWDKKKPEQFDLQMLKVWVYCTREFPNEKRSALFGSTWNIKM